MSFTTVAQTCRPSFLVLTPVCVLLGASIAIKATGTVDVVTLLIVLVGALSAHISVNMLNEYYDFKSGLDLQTKKTPFSGGSGALPRSPHLAPVVFILGIAALVLTLLIGLYFIFKFGVTLIPIGVVGIGLVFTYTKTLNRFPILCLLSPGLGFGVLMTMGTYIVLAGQPSTAVCFVSFIPFFLINNLLLLNQYPDIEADTSVGRKTFPIVFGIKCSNLVYLVFMLASYLLLMVLIMIGTLPTLSYIAFIPLAFSVYSFTGAVKFESAIGEHPKYMAANVMSAIFTPFLLSTSIFISN